MSDTWRGHPIEEYDIGRWRYSDTGEAVQANPDRACGHCGLTNTSTGADGCFGALPGVINACCGHGQHDEAYLILEGGRSVRGADAIAVAAALRKAVRGP